MNAKVYDFDTATVREFKYLAEALRYVSVHKITGYVVTPTSEVIDTRKGKRKSADGRKWVACAAGMTVEPTEVRYPGKGIRHLGQQLRLRILWNTWRYGGWPQMDRRQCAGCRIRHGAVRRPEIGRGYLRRSCGR